MIIKKSKLLVSIVLSFLIFGCNVQQKGDLKIKNILIGIEINIANKYVYDSESIYVINSDSISLRKKAEYDNKGELKLLTLFKSEGALTYSRLDILYDTALLNHTGISIKNNWRFINDTLITNCNDSLAVEEQGEKIFVNKNNNRLTIFELYY